MRPTKSLSRRTANPDSLVKKGVYNNHKTFTHRKSFFSSRNTRRSEILGLAP